MKAPPDLDVFELYDWVHEEAKKAIADRDVQKLKEIQRFTVEYDGPKLDTGFEFFPVMLPLDLYEKVYG